MNKYKVTFSYHKEEGAEYESIYAETPQQAEEIATQMLKDRRRDFEEMKDLRACVIAATK